MSKDPVCSSEVEELDAMQAGLTSDHLSRVYYFCSSACKTRFDREPFAFVEHSMNWEEWDIPDWAWTTK